MLLCCHSFVADQPSWPGPKAAPWPTGPDGVLCFAAVVALVVGVVGVAGVLTGELVTVEVERAGPVDVVDVGVDAAWLGAETLTNAGVAAGGGDA